MKRFTTTLFGLLLAAAAAQAQAPAQAPASGPGDGAAAAADAPMSDGEIRRIDKAGGKVTIRHAAIEHLDMPPMTMVFQVRDTAMLDAVQVGDKVRFSVVIDGGTMTIVRLQPNR